MSHFVAIGRPVRPLFSAAVGDQKSFRVRDVTGFGGGRGQAIRFCRNVSLFVTSGRLIGVREFGCGARYPRENSNSPGRTAPACACATATKPGSIIAGGIATG